MTASVYEENKNMPENQKQRPKQHSLLERILNKVVGRVETKGSEKEIIDFVSDSLGHMIDYSHEMAKIHIEKVRQLQLLELEKEQLKTSDKIKNKLVQKITKLDPYEHRKFQILTEAEEKKNHVLNNLVRYGRNTDKFFEQMSVPKLKDWIHFPTTLSEAEVYTRIAQYMETEFQTIEENTPQYQAAFSSMNEIHIKKYMMEQLEHTNDDRRQRGKSEDRRRMPDRRQSQDRRVLGFESIDQTDGQGPNPQLD